MPTATTHGESRVLEQAGSGDVVDLSDLPEDQRVLAADFVRRQCLETETADPRGFRIKGASLQGRLDLAFCTFERPLDFSETTFSEPPCFDNCSLPDFALRDCRLPGLEAEQLRVEFDLDLSGVEAGGAVVLSGARIAGRLICDGATLSNEGGWALVAEGAEIGGGVLLRNGFSATGGIFLLGAKVGGSLVCDGATLSNDGGWALDAEVAEIGGGVLLRNGFSATGGVRLLGAKVGVNLECVGATLANENGWALDAAGAEVAGHGFLGFSATGGVRLFGAKVGGSLMCDGATLSNDGGWALDAEVAEIGGSVLLRNGFSATGGVRLFGAKVGVNLECVGATLANEDGWALDAEGADVGRAFMISSVNLAGGLNLFKMRCATLYDDIGPQSGLGSWAGATPLVLAGFSYDRFGGDVLAWGTDARFSWLEKTTSFDPGSWQRLIEVYRAHGQDDEARRTAIAMQNDRLGRANLAPHRRLGRWILRVTIGHGYRSSLALLWATAIVLPLALAVWRAPKGTFVPTEPGVAGSPQPVVYAVDTFLPIVDLGEADKWVATGSLQWAVWAVIILGWILSTIFVAGFTRIVRTV